MSEHMWGPGSPADEEQWEALARFVDGESPPAEAAVIQQWLDGDIGRAEMIRALDARTRSLAYHASGDLDVEAALRRTHVRMQEADTIPFPVRPALAARAEERSSHRWRTTGLRAAAAIALVLGAGVVWKRATDAPVAGHVALADVHQTGVGQMDTVMLGDGSRIVLGPQSRLTVAEAYGRPVRAVQLEGEALFEVQHDEARPFRVRAGEALIDDLGTTFTVRSDPDQAVHVAVTEGSVRLQPASGAEGIVLAAGQIGVLDDGRAVANKLESAEAELAWTRGRIVFEEATLADVARELKRWYGIELRNEDGALAGRHLTATFAGESRSQVLSILELALGARIEQRGDTAIVRPRTEAR